MAPDIEAVLKLLLEGKVKRLGFHVVVVIIVVVVVVFIIVVIVLNS